MIQTSPGNSGILVTPDGSVLMADPHDSSAWRQLPPSFNNPWFARYVDSNSCRDFDTYPKVFMEQFPTLEMTNEMDQGMFIIEGSHVKIPGSAIYRIGQFTVLLKLHPTDRFSVCHCVSVGDVIQFARDPGHDFVFWSLVHAHMLCEDKPSAIVNGQTVTVDFAERMTTSLLVTEADLALFRTAVSVMKTTS
jgi:hypothetical protein